MLIDEPGNSITCQAEPDNEQVFREGVFPGGNVLEVETGDTMTAPGSRHNFINIYTEVQQHEPSVLGSDVADDTPPIDMAPGLAERRWTSPEIKARFPFLYICIDTDNSAVEDLTNSYHSRIECICQPDYPSCSAGKPGVSLPVSRDAVNPSMGS